MSGVTGYKFRKRTVPKVPKKRKPRPRPPWNDAITDLSAFASTPQEISRRRLIHRSKNAEKARLQLLEKKCHAQWDHEDPSFSTERSEWDCSEGPTANVKQSTMPRALNELGSEREFLRKAGHGFVSALKADDMRETETDPIPNKNEGSHPDDIAQEVSLRTEVKELRSLVYELTKEILSVQDKAADANVNEVPEKRSLPRTASYRKTCTVAQRCDVLPPSSTSVFHQALLIQPPTQIDLSKSNHFY